MKAMRVTGWVLLGVALIVLVGAITIKVRGFRATEEPSHFEAAVARGVRNFAIPRAEARRANPYPSDTLAVQQGRELFLTRCATCHGVDGRGTTPIGRNTYPRVPDLHAGATQDLSDGQIHSIIEDGVQLSGMPAMPGLRSPAKEDSWALVSYIRSLRTPSSADVRLLQASTEGARYVGSQSCERCHSAIYERWKKTPMANVVRDPREQPDAILPDLKTNDVAKFTADQVALVYGSIWKQRYFTKVGDDYYPLSAQWDIGNKKWMKYHVADTGADWWAAFYPSDNMQRPTGPTCDGCHSVDYDIHTKKVAEWNVGCERCHGPGSEHVAHPTRLNIQNPSQMDSVASNDTCIQCHSQGQPKTKIIEGKAYDWPVGYEVGKRLQDYWSLEDMTLGQTDFLHFADGTAHKNRMQGNDFIQSVMYEKGVTCASCHDVHGTANYAQLRKPADKICLDCHAANSPNGPHVASLEEHTHHKAGSPGSQCIACHMPKIETQGVPGAFVRSHTFRFITPAMTEKYKIPNSCTSCHMDKSTDWATKELLGWKEMSPWRIAQR
ncbi:c-type cytochrome [Granulicella sp. dw_53]|uniref:c-type cytochrome n=1 Tax=Granulicella sp. dw_53 TaxID=2719792 RepID=UPI001BD447F4|nr:c-type cytochrome [Granulicella sp. dw_53]